MKRSRYIYLFICITVALTIYKFSTTESNHLNPLNSLDPLDICKKDYKIRGASFQFNYRGLSLISNPVDSIDLVLCPGDFFGDLHNTYVIVEDCNLAMYHKGSLIWSSEKTESFEENMGCAISLQRDGNLVVSKESMTCFYPVKAIPVFWPTWSSQTDFKPNKTEMRIQGQQLQIIQSFFQNGTQRLFYTGEGLRRFHEDLGPPKQIAKKFLVVNHTDVSDVILRRNEYIGDLNGLHLILQTNCDLQLKKFSRSIWSFAAYFEHGEECTLSVEGNSIGIPKLPGNGYRFEGTRVLRFEGMKILPSHDFTVIQSNITFFGDQLLIVQTLNDGSEISFYSEPGQDNGLKLKRELTQIAQNNMTISSEVTFRRMDYIGDLHGLHLILQDDCVFKLANGQQELWKLKKNVDRPWMKKWESIDGPFMECSLQFNNDGAIMFNAQKNNNENERRGQVQVFGKKYPESGDFPSEFQLSLENNIMILTLEYQNNVKKIHHAGVNTNGTWFQALSSM